MLRYITFLPGQLLKDDLQSISFTVLLFFSPVRLFEQQLLLENGSSDNGNIVLAIWEGGRREWSERLWFSFSPVLNSAFSNDSISLMNALGLNIVADFFFFFHFWNQAKVFQSWGKNINCLRYIWFHPKKPFVFF